MPAPFIRIKTKFIILFSVLMAVVLLLQFYFMDRAQNEIVEELQRMSTRINAATDIIYVGEEEKIGVETLPKVMARDKLKKGLPPRAVAILEEKDNEFVVRVETKVDTDLQNSWTTWKTLNKKSKTDIKKIEEQIKKNSFFIDIKSDSDSGLDKKKVHEYSWTYENDTLESGVDINDNFLLYNLSEEDSLHAVIREIHANAPGPKDRAFSFTVPHFDSPGSPRFVRYNYNYEELYDALKGSRNRNIIITLILFGLSIAGITIIARNFEKPIHDLRDSFTKVVGGDLDARVDVISNDEVGELAGSFNLMVDELRKNREKEQLLNRKERLAALGQLAAGVAHEIKNPLNAINLTITHLDDKFVDGEDEAARKYISTIQEEIGRLDKTVNDFLNYVRSDALDRKKTDVNALLDDILRLYEREISHNHIQLEKNYAKKFALKLDSERIKTALINIILNAIQSMPEGGKLSIFTKSRTKEIIIKDSGIGIPEKDLTTIFDLFFTTKATGTGLGLPTAYKIIKAHEGEIHINSKVDSGTEIIIRFEQEK